MLLAMIIAGWSLVDIAIAVVVAAAIIALVVIALKVFEVTPPWWATRALWVVVVAFVIIMCIRLVSQM